jgi:hypothetical protein
MSNRQNGALPKLLLDSLLNKFVILGVDVGCCLIYNHNLAVFQKGSTNTKELLLPG